MSKLWTPSALPDEYMHDPELAEMARVARVVDANMAQPTFQQYRQNSGTPGPGMNNEELWERILTCFSVMASAQNPDGTAWSGFGAGGGGVTGGAFMASAVVTASHNYSTVSTTPVAVDTTNLTVSFTTKVSGPGSTSVLVRFWGVYVAPATFSELCVLNHNTTTVVPGSQKQDMGTSSACLGFWIPVTGLATNTAFQWDLGFDNPAGNSVQLICGGSGGVNGTIGMVVEALG